MLQAFHEMLHGWQNFYFMAGGAAAALLGLMFVAISMGMGVSARTTPETFQAFVTPSVNYFVSVLLFSGVMLIPSPNPSILAAVLFISGIAGLAKIRRPVRHLIQAARKHQDFTLGDWLAQIIMPILSYSLILTGGIGIAIDQWPVSFTGLWTASIFLLLCGIANTWSLVMWIIQKGIE